MSLYRLARVTIDLEPEADLEWLRHELALIFGAMAAEWEKGEPLRSCIREVFVPDGPDDN